ncbi:hypothetical protein [Nocardia sp. NRRL WC-3656]|uniref:hypothetical protein n=1 Tax=Nocardia sp. NRRL WC-3656 TaxID=1463824 RepID=UPI0004C31CF7|nr:hypothetical protein [Nocardia sp. NRRL WC-3656]
MARTSTYTATFARLKLLQINIKAALAEIGWPDGEINRLVDTGLADDNRWIQKFHSYGKRSPEGDEWVLHFYIDIDWDEHGRMVVEFPEMGAPDQWRQGVNPGLRSAARDFAQLLDDEQLVLVRQVTLADWVYDDPAQMKLVQNELKLTSAKKLAPAGEIETTGADMVGDLSELTFAIEIAYDEDGS